MKKSKLVICLIIFILSCASCATLKSITDVGPVVGSIESNVYHLPYCHYVNYILPGNIIEFANTDSAKAHGYRPCLVCLKRYLK